METKLTRARLAEEIATQVDVTLKEAKQIEDVILDCIVRALRAGDRVEIRGFGSFRTHTRGPRSGRNPKTGAKVPVPTRIVPRFKPSLELLTLINGRGSQPD